MTGPNGELDKVTGRARQLMTSELLTLGDQSTRDPEIGFAEDRAMETLTRCLQKLGLKLRWASPDCARPTLGEILKHDALRGTKGAFHGHQHSAQGPIGIAAAVATAEYLDRKHLPGTIFVFGTPGEERLPPVAKIDMFRAGMSRGVDVLLRSHAVNATDRPRCRIRNVLPEKPRLWL